MKIHTAKGSIGHIFVILRDKYEILSSSDEIDREDSIAYSIVQLSFEMEEKNLHL